MKKLFFLLALIAITLGSYSQITPGKTTRIADRVTVFAANLSVGTTIYCASDFTFWAVKAPTVSTLTITTALAAATIIQIGGAGSAPIMITENFEIGGDGIKQYVTLGFEASDTTSFRISLNGVEVNHAGLTGQSWVAPLVDKKVYFRIPAYQYDVVCITYSYIPVYEEPE